MLKLIPVLWANRELAAVNVRASQCTSDNVIAGLLDSLGLPDSAKHHNPQRMGKHAPGTERARRWLPRWGGLVFATMIAEKAKGMHNSNFD